MLEQGIINQITDSTISELNLSSCKLTQQELSQLVGALQTNRSLTSLDLSGNEIGHQGAKDIANAIQNNTTLKSIGLSWNRIGDQGAKHIANAMENNRTLTSLDLSRNLIGDQGAKDIANAMENNTTLKSIDLSGNRIGDQGAKDIANAIQQNTTLTSIHFSGNRIDVDSECIEAILQALDKNELLTTVNLGTLSKKNQETLNIYLKRNQNYRYNARFARQKAIPAAPACAFRPPAPVSEDNNQGSMQPLGSSIENLETTKNSYHSALDNLENFKTQNPLLQRRVTELLHEVRKLNNKKPELQPDLENILKDTQDLLENKLSPKDYQDKANQVQGSPSKALQIIGASMATIGTGLLASGVAAIPGGFMLGTGVVTAALGCTFFVANGRSGLSKKMNNVANAMEQSPNLSY